MTSFRLIRIVWCVARYLFTPSFLKNRFPKLACLSYLNPLAWRKPLPRAQALTQALITLGPLFVKFGQIISTRVDMLPPDFASALATLQDSVPPFSSTLAQTLIERSLGQPVDVLFDNFDPEPLAAASIAQVHTATLKTGERVVIKVLRPNIQTIIRRDIKLLYCFARLSLWCFSQAHRLKPADLVREFETTLYDELDLMREAASASYLKRNFKDTSMLYVPKVYWALTRSNVMVMERIDGVPVNDVETLSALGVDLKRLAEMGVEIFFTQVFRDSFFHADMHPGNIFVNVDDPGNAYYCGVDFGIMGTLTEEDQRYLGENFLAFFNRDYRQVAQLHIDSGWVPKTTRVDQLESAIRTVCEPFFEQPIKHLSFGRFLMQLFKTAERFDMYIQPQLFLLQKTLINIEGLGRQLYPELDLWSTAKPILEQFMKKRLRGKALLQHIFKEYLNIKLSL